MKRRNLLLIALCASLLGYSSGTYAGGEAIAVVVHKSNPVKQLGKDDLRQIFQTTKTTFPGGGTVTAVNLPEDNQIRKDFDQAVMGLDPDRVARYWMDRKIRGDARPPKKVPTPAAVLRTVGKTEGAIGYVPQGEVNADVKVVAKVANGKVLSP